jgi:ubiquinone/menaquinone biosynthesis C-methylase UbiE
MHRTSAINRFPALSVALAAAEFFFRDHRPAGGQRTEGGLMLNLQKKPYKGIGMEGHLARWYAKNTAKDLTPFRELAARIAEHLPAGSAVLEVVPGPGYLAIELARLERYRITGLDISRTFVQTATDNARKAGVEAEFRVGDAAAMPFSDETFDFVVCRAAFKNFSAPVGALREILRVLKPGGEALVIDMRRDATNEEIDSAVRAMPLSAFDRLITKATFKYMLRPRAYSRDAFQAMVGEAGFTDCAVEAAPIGFEASLRKGNG